MNVLGRGMKNAIRLAACAAAASVGATGAAHAQGEVTANVTFTSNYVLRGLSQSDEGFAIQGSVDYTHDVFYAGVWASSVDDFEIDASTEIDLYAGVTPTWGPVEFDISVLAYFYPGTTENIDFVELMAAAAYAPTEQFTIGAVTYASNDFINSGEASLYAEANAAFAFTEALAVSGAVGNQGVDNSDDYTTWNVGATLITHGFALDLRYHDIDLEGFDDQVSFAVSREF